MVRTLRTALMILSVAVIALAASGCGRQEGETETREAATETAARASGTGGSTGDARGVGTAVGQVPPPFTLTDLSGNEVSLSDFKGSVVILDLWATWCPPCRKEIPFLVSLYEEHRDEGLVVIGVGLDRGGADVLRPFVESNNVTYSILVGGESISRDYKVSSIPMTFMIDRNGVIAKREIGFGPDMEDGMRSAVLELLARPATEA